MIDNITYKVTNVEMKEMQKKERPFFNRDDNENESNKKDKYKERWNIQQQQRQSMKLYNNTN